MGFLKELKLNNGSPFNSLEFRNLPKNMDYNHRITPEHPRENGEAKRVMKILNKTEKIAHSEGTMINEAKQNMLMGYRSTPHPATSCYILHTRH